MDKLQWFKFTPSDWMMGKIQRCPEITQARFMRLCCLYWNKECLLSFEDAEIEIDKEHLEILISKKIIKSEDDFIKIEFLDEQMDGIIETSEKRRAAVLKRWNKVKQKDTSVLQDDTSVLQNDTDKIREDKIREEEIKEDNNKSIFSFSDFWQCYPKKVGKTICEKKYNKLTEKDRELIKNSIDKFVKHKPFKDYVHPNPQTYINQKRWLDEIEEVKEVKKVYSVDNY